MIVAAVASNDEQRQHGARCEAEERIQELGLRLEHQCALAEVVQQQAGPHEREPREPHGLLAEVAHVGVERLAAREHEEHGAQDRERDRGMLREQRERVAREQGREHVRLDARSR